jgi:acyl-CoA synthetase (AMP-forming)/AMP-acid ligase II
VTTALFNQFIFTNPSFFQELRVVIFGGEAADARRVRECAIANPPPYLWNAYGPTENAVIATCYRIREVSEEDMTIPIGYPIHNTQTYVLNAHMQPVPVGVEGELYLGGLGLARGYLNKPEQTAERFVPHPFTQEAGARLYRTGDLVRRLENGAIEFIRRVDHQVKIRGHRIELGEIETLLAAHSAVRDCLIIAQEDQPGEKYLVAYLVYAQPCSIEELRAYLKDKLPGYMIPSLFVVLDAFPLTTNGKVDRRALSAMSGLATAAHTDASPPRTATEHLLWEIWKRVLGQDTIGIHDTFFELGGHSLAVTRVVNQIQSACGVDLSLRSFYEAPTISELAHRIDILRSLRVSLEASEEASEQREEGVI